MTDRWTEYEVFDPGPGGPLQDRSRADARTHFKKLMAEKEHRKDELAKLVARDGVELETNDEGLQRLNDWFLACLEEDPDEPGRLVKEWYSVINDLAVFLGDVVIERAPSIRWEFYTWGRKNLSYQKHVLMGFDVPNPKYNVDFDRLLAGYAHEHIWGNEVERDQFVAAVRSSVNKALKS